MQVKSVPDSDHVIVTTGTTSITLTYAEARKLADDIGTAIYEESKRRCVVNPRRSPIHWRWSFHADGRCFLAAPSIPFNIAVLHRTWDCDNKWTASLHVGDTITPVTNLGKAELAAVIRAQVEHSPYWHEGDTQEDIY